MRAPGLQIGFLQALSAGPVPDPSYASGAIGHSFFTPEQGAFRAQRRRYGSLDDPDAGGYSLAMIDWNKDDGTCEYGPMEATSDGWYAT
jgi:hypothetical protein